MEKTLAQMKNFIGEAVLVFFLYMFFYLPGLIVNILYYIESRRIEKLAGQKPAGQGCLVVLLVWGVLVLFALFFLLSTYLPMASYMLEELMQ